jgi:MFS family permease
VAALLVGAGGNALGQLSSNVVLAHGVPKHRQGLSFGVKQSAIPLCTLLAGAAVPTIALTIGWRWAFVIAAVLAFAALPLTVGGTSGRGPRSARADTAERATLALTVVAAGAALAAGAASALGIFLVDSSVAQGIDVTLAATTLTIGSVIGLSARLLGGWLADRRSGGHLLVISGLLAVGALGLGLLAVPGVAALLIGTALGYGLGWSWPGLLNFAVVRLHPTAPAAATSITQLGVYVGGSIGPVGFGLIAAHLGYSAAWLCSAGAMIVSAALVLAGRRMLVAYRTAREPAAARR